LATPNHLPTPVLAGIDPATISDADCEQLIAKYCPAGAQTDPETGQPRWTGSHGSNRNFPITNPTRHQSHHVLQDGLMINSTGARIMTNYSGFAAMLEGGSHAPGSEHKIANDYQATRRTKEFKKANPAPKWGEIKEWGKRDLVAAFQHGNPSRNFQNDDAEKLAICLVRQADAAAQQHRRDNNKPRLDDERSRVTLSPGCFPLDTLVWTSQAVLVAAEHLEIGDLLETSSGTLRITRIDECFSELVEITLGDEAIALAPAHRVHLADGRHLSADRVRVGHRLRTRTGEISVTCVSRRAPELIIAVAFAHPADCFLGRTGIAVEATSGAPPVVARSRVEGRPACPA
jgi:hypothetical protein